MKKLFVFLLLLLPAAIVSGQNVTDSGTCGATDNEDNVKWELTDDGTLTISGTGAMADYANYTDAPWVSNAADIKTVVIKDGVTNIGSGAFMNVYPNIIQVTIPESVEMIGGSSFRGCTSLSAVVIPSKVVKIGNYAFNGCTSLTKVTIPSNVTNIGDLAFGGCDDLKEVIVLATTPPRLGFYAFYSISILDLTVYVPVDSFDAYEKASNWSALNIQKLVVASGTCGANDNASNVIWSFNVNGTLIISGTGDMADYANYTEVPWVSNAADIKTVVIEDGVTNIGSGAFMNIYPNITQVTIPESVESIGDHAFNGCTSLASVVIPSRVLGIGNSAFNGCSSLSELHVLAAVPPSLGIDVFNNVDMGLTVYVPSIALPSYVDESWGGFSNFDDTVASGTCGAESDGSNVKWKLTDDGTLTISGVGDMADYANYTDVPWVSNAADIKTVIIEEGVTNIGSGAFMNVYPNITQVTIPESVESIGDSAFKGCSSLTNVTLPDGLESIGYSAFDGCSNLETISLNKDLASIGNYAFQNCSKLKSVTLPDGLESLGSSAFYDCSGLQSVTLNEGLERIGYSAFQNCSSLASVDIPSSVTEIGGGAFDGTAWYNNAANWDGDLLYNGTALIAAKQDISGDCEIKVGTTVISDNAFAGCSDLTSVILPEGLINMGNETFVACMSLTSINIPSSVTSIGSAVFAVCENLTSVTLPDGLESIGESAFANCYSLTSIEIPSSVTEICDGAFNNCSSLSSIKVAAAVPPTTYMNTFRGVDKYYPVYVPKGSLAAYEASNYWEYFFDFVEYEVTPSAVEETAAAEVSIYSLNGRIYCDAETFAIYNLSGQNVSAQNGSLHGLYIVVIDGNVVKVRVN